MCCVLADINFNYIEYLPGESCRHIILVRKSRILVTIAHKRWHMLPTSIRPKHGESANRCGSSIAWTACVREFT